jgi:hypothetical protein
VWFLLLADTNPGFRLARDLGFGPALQFGEILYALVGLTAAAAPFSVSPRCWSSGGGGKSFLSRG